MKRILLALVALLVACACAQPVPSLKLIGSYVLPNDTVFEGTRVGGISGLSYDASTGLAWLLSDDKSEFAPARVYTAKLVFDQDSFDAVELRSVVTLLQPNGSPFPEGRLDPEGLRASGGRLYLSSEGQNDDEAVIAPMLWEAAFDGSFVQDFDLPAVYLPQAGQDVGVRDNLAFESVALSPDAPQLFVANENSLLQDGPISNLTETGVVRITRFDL
ncbi:MAG TPA: esterase-like activity of phytase family protein, partial [Trueperaceae bacterium]